MHAQKMTACQRPHVAGRGSSWQGHCGSRLHEHGDGHTQQGGVRPPRPTRAHMRSNGEGESVSLPLTPIVTTASISPDKHSGTHTHTPHTHSHPRLHAARRAPWHLKAACRVDDDCVHAQPLALLNAPLGNLHGVDLGGGVGGVGVAGWGGVRGLQGFEGGGAGVTVCLLRNMSMGLACCERRGSDTTMVVQQPWPAGAPAGMHTARDQPAAWT